MAQADTLVNLLKAASNGDLPTFRKAAESLIVEERSKGHRILADRLTKSMLPSVHTPNRPAITSPIRSGIDMQRDFFHEIQSERPLASLVISPLIADQIREFVEEQHRSELLRSHNLRPRNSVLLAGPPGNGKTSLAEAIAYELMVPILVVRYENLIGSYLGETSSRLKNLIEYAKTQRCVLFFDEFDTLGKERGDTHETGEIKRVVSSLLLQLDGLPDYVVVVAASNHPELLDRAVWRRFQLRLELHIPTGAQLSAFIASLSERCKVNFGYSSDALAKHLSGINFSEAEEFCLGVVRRAILDQKVGDARSITAAKLNQWRRRLRPMPTD
jgi:AAA+ superfamily predicted ATPase